MADVKRRYSQWFGVYTEKGYVNVVSPEELNGGAPFSLRIPLADGADGDRVFRSKSGFRQAFGQIVRIIHNELGAGCDPEFIIALPDNYGLIEQLRILSYAAENGITVKRFVYKSLAVASSIAARDHGRNSDSGRAIITGASGEVRWFSAIEIDDGFIEKEATVVYKKSRTKAEGFRAVNAEAEWMYCLDRAAGIYFLETGRDELTEKIVSQRGYSGMKSGGNMYSATPSMIADGLKRHILTLTGRSEELWLSTSAPYDLWIEICGQVIRLLGQNTTTPTRSEEYVCNLPFTGNAGNEKSAALCEERFGRLMRVADLDFDTAILESRGKLNVWITVDANASVLLGLENPAEKKQEKAVIRRYTGPEPAAAGTPLQADLSLNDLLPLIDNLEYGYSMSAGRNDPGTEGLQKLLLQALDILRSHGIERISAEGKSFDYNYHEAVSHVTDPFLPENFVKEVIQSGYTKDGRLIRAAKVVVAN